MQADSSIVHPGVRFLGTHQLDEFVIVGRPTKPGAEPTETVIGNGCVLRSSTVIYAGNRIGEGFQTGHGALLRHDNVIGDRCSVGTGSVIEFAVRLGNGVRIHSQAFIPEYCILEDDCWIGPNVVLTNAPYPSSTNAKHHLSGVTIRRRARIGANATILPGVTVGEDALVGAGAVVTRDVPARAVVAGNPAKQIKTIDELAYDSGDAAY